MSKLMPFLLSACVVFAMGAQCAVSNAEPAQETSLKSSSLPDYDFPHRDGLFATISGYLEVKKVQVPGERGVELAVPGFCKALPVKAVIQDHVAPLVVVLLGLGGRTESDFSRVWPSWFSNAGYHVLYFDSTFGASFQNSTCHGVSGDIYVEAECVSEAIAAFLKHPEIQGKISDIGVVGYSYGGTEALILGRMATEGRLPFKLSAIQAYAPPADLQKTAMILDDWYRNDRWRYTLVELKRMFANMPACPSCCSKAPASAMRAAIAASFRIDLAGTIVANDAQYKLGVLPRGNEFDEKFVKRDHAESIAFEEFARDIAIPYWQKHLGYATIYEQIFDATLCRLLLFQPDYSETIIAEDDPFIMPEDVADARVCGGQAHLTVLPRGGHMGYMSHRWTRAKLLTLFAGHRTPGQRRVAQE